MPPEDESGAPAPEIDWSDDTAVVNAILAGETEPAEASVEPADSQQTATESVVPDAASQEPVAQTPPPYKFNPIEFELEPGGQRIKVESEDELREAFRLKAEFGRQTRKHAAKENDWEKQRQEKDEELQLLRDLKKQVEPILNGIKAKPEFGDYLRDELGLDATPDPEKIALEQRLARYDQVIAKQEFQERRSAVIGTLDASRREHFGYETTIRPEEVAIVEEYAAQNGISKSQLYSLPPIVAAGIYTVLVGMHVLAPPRIPVAPGAPGNGVQAKAASAANLPPASSGAPTAPKPYDHKGKTPDDVLRDMQELGDIDAETLRLLGVKAKNK